MRSSVLQAPGAELYYEVRGSGPVLLLICGGVYDAAAYQPLAEALADRYTVVTYDRRGNSRSPLNGPPEAQSIEVHGRDAQLVLSAVRGTEPAYVFGNSSGAIVGLALAARYPEHVRGLVAHEPPIFELLSDREYWRGVIDNVEKTFRSEGPTAAGQVLGAAFAEQGGGSADGGEAEEQRMPGGALSEGEPDPETAAMLMRFAKNMEFFIGYEVPPFARYVPDFSALRESGVRVVAAAGEASEGEPPYRAAFAVAEQVGTAPAIFPGDHGGFGVQPEAFGARLHGVISGHGG
ncbi:alpha/beta hydrolase [Acrocarpospora corrugata]|uniref:Alpha/beta hydrolase n=1 Tax=Acrocarpospora corrugata TaxID=35763 RepID=A0A5M3VZC2_9ACTN|nr:alpha/beta hydrolase [Acrocarpospora corrugata]GES01290.1 alpha/beta hydrolase [Acrocarpospora corrugata]